MTPKQPATHVAAGSFIEDDDPTLQCATNHRLGVTRQMSPDSLVIAICTARTEDLRLRLEHNLSHSAGHELFVVVDGEETPDIAELASRIRGAGGTVVIHGRNRGLSPARNTVLDLRPTSRILYTDDDVWLDRDAIRQIQAAFERGAHVVGARLVPPEDSKPWPWYFTEAQMHLVSWHSPNAPIKVWGACMGIDARFAHEMGIRYSDKLGRSGNRLESGDDTSFVAQMKTAGAVEALLDTTNVVHDIDRRRLRIGYLLRRVYWQGRSEIRRGQASAGLRKEWRRHTDIAWPLSLLALPYTASFVVGVVVERLTSISTSSQKVRHTTTTPAAS